MSKRVAVVTGIAFLVNVTGTASVQAAPTADVVAGATSAPATNYLDKVKGCTRHVRVNASGGGTGTSGSPWTLVQAMERLEKGQTACVHAGDYTVPATVAALKPKNTGTEEAPIALRAAPGEDRPVIRPHPTSSSKRLFDFADGIGYWVLRRLDLRMRQKPITAIHLLGGTGPNAKGVGPVAIRDNIIRYGAASAAVLIRNGGHDILIDDNIISDHHRWCDPGWDIRCDPKDEYFYTEGAENSGRRRDDANGINLEGVGNARVRVAENDLERLGGDGLQCLGSDGKEESPSDANDAADVDIVDNRANNNAENAVDIKSCQRVSVRNTAAADPRYRFADLLPTNRSKDSGGIGGNNASGDAIVIHYFARKVLVDRVRVRRTCTAVSIGRDDWEVKDVVVKRITTSDMRHGTVNGGNCRGNGITVNLARHADLHANQIGGIRGNAVVVASYNSKAQTSDDVDVFNNVIRTVGTSSRWIHAWKPYLTNFDSDNNTLCVTGEQPRTTAHFVVGGDPMGGDPVDLPKWRNVMAVDHTSTVSCP